MRKSTPKPPPRLMPSEPGWKPSDLDLWEKATVCGHRRALSYRWWLRAHSRPGTTTAPKEPLLALMHRLEIDFRRLREHCRGAVDER